MVLMQIRRHTSNIHYSLVYRDDEYEYAARAPRKIYQNIQIEIIDRCQSRRA